MPSVMATQSRIPASAASMIESAANGGGTKTMLAVDQRHMHRVLLHGLHDAFGDPVAAVDAGKDVDQDRLYVVVRHDQPERLGHAIRRGTAADVEEVGRLAARQLDHVHSRHGEAG